MSDTRGPTQPPGPAVQPILGSTFSYAQDPLAFIRRVADEYGDVATYRVGGEQMYQVSSPEFVKRVLVDDNEHYVKGDLFQDALRPVLGNGLLTSEGEFWREQRHTMQPGFHPDAIQAYADVMVEYTERLLEDWTDGETRDVHEDMMRLTVEIAAKILFDVRLNDAPSSQSESQSDSDDVDIRTEEAAVGEALEAVMDLTARNLRSPVNIPTWIPTPTNRRYEQALEKLDDISAKIIQERKSEGVGDDPTDVVGLLLNAYSTGAPIDDTYYDDPWTFRPERWTDEFEKDRPAFAYFPFGGGPRRCIGDRFALQEARLALATIARNWTLEPEHDLEFVPSITLRPKDEVRMTVRQR